MDFHEKLVWPVTSPRHSDKKPAQRKKNSNRPGLNTYIKANWFDIPLFLFEGTDAHGLTRQGRRDMSLPLINLSFQGEPREPQMTKDPCFTMNTSCPAIFLHILVRSRVGYKICTFDPLIWNFKALLVDCLHEGGKGHKIICYSDDKYHSPPRQCAQYLTGPPYPCSHHSPPGKFCILVQKVKVTLPCRK